MRSFTPKTKIEVEIDTRIRLGADVSRYEWRLRTDGRSIQAGPLHVFVSIPVLTRRDHKSLCKRAWFTSTHSVDSYLRGWGRNSLNERRCQLCMHALRKIL